MDKIDEYNEIVRDHRAPMGAKIYAVKRVAQIGWQEAQRQAMADALLAAYFGLPKEARK